MTVLILILVQIIFLAFCLKVIFAGIDSMIASCRTTIYRWRWRRMQRSRRRTPWLQLPKLRLPKLPKAKLPTPPEPPQTQLSQPPEPPQTQLPKPPEPPQTQLPKPPEPPKIKNDSARTKSDNHNSLKRIKSYTAWSKLMIRLQNDNRAAERLIKSLMSRYPGESELWYIEKALRDLDRDRR